MVAEKKLFILLILCLKMLNCNSQLGFCVWKVVSNVEQQGDEQQLDMSWLDMVLN